MLWLYDMDSTLRGPVDVICGRLNGSDGSANVVDTVNPSSPSTTPGNFFDFPVSELTANRYLNPELDCSS